MAFPMTIHLQETRKAIEKRFMPGDSEIPGGSVLILLPIGSGLRMLDSTNGRKLISWRADSIMVGIPWKGLTATTLLLTVIRRVWNPRFGNTTKTLEIVPLQVDLSIAGVVFQHYMDVIFTVITARDASGLCSTPRISHLQTNFC